MTVRQFAWFVIALSCFITLSALMGHFAVSRAAVPESARLGLQLALLDDVARTSIGVFCGIGLLKLREWARAGVKAFLTVQIVSLAISVIVAVVDLGQAEILWPGLRRILLLLPPMAAAWWGIRFLSREEIRSQFDGPAIPAPAVVAAVWLVTRGLLDLTTSASSLAYGPMFQRGNDGLGSTLLLWLVGGLVQSAAGATLWLGGLRFRGLALAAIAAGMVKVASEPFVLPSSPSTALVVNCGLLFVTYATMGYFLLKWERPAERQQAVTGRL